ncbi:MAG: metallophosphoesterase, partial [Bacteroidetes bacterium]|nr:metallophosphoesterase [Bacteroidota bacterium]
MKALVSIFFLLICSSLFAQTNDRINIWITSDAHVWVDYKNYGRKSIEQAIAQSEGRDSTNALPFPWEIMLSLGDFASSHEDPTDIEGEMARDQLNSGVDHIREQIYTLIGNHDANQSDKPENIWFRTYIDPLGENTSVSGVDSSKRPYPVTGTYERYSFQLGNVLFLMLGDRNDFPVEQGGRGISTGGYPAGKITMETFNWWKDMVENNQDKIIITCHHHMIRSTTMGSGPYEGVNFHGVYPGGFEEGTSYLYFVGDDKNSNLIVDYLRNNHGAIDMWIGGHTHIRTPDAVYNDKTYAEEKFGVMFINASSLARFNISTSRLLSFFKGSNVARLNMYLHTPYKGVRDWYKPAKRLIKLKHPFEFSQGPGTI